MPHSNLDRYILKGGIDGSARLKILAEALIVDAASGGGDVSLMLSQLAGPRGHVTGFDLDAAILTAASKRAAEESATNLRFMVADVTKPWLANQVDLVYARFILTHLAEPEAMLAEARAALVPRGRIVVEDIDSDGVFWDPPHAAMDKLMQIYVSVSKARGGDPFIGRRLHRLLSDNGFADVRTNMVHPFGRSGPAKLSPALIGPSISDAAVGLGIMSKADMDALNEDLFAFANHPETTIAMPRVFQAWGTKA
jgi:SAM-dependent methyltransferase